MIYATKDINRFWSKVKRASGCWLWTGALNKQGYGIFGMRDASALRAHRVAYELTHGDIPAGMIICHSCDNPSCIRPEHLFIGTSADNIQDASRKKRLRSFFRKGPNHWSHLFPEQVPRGSIRGHAKLTEEKVLEIRKSKNKTKSQLAREYGVSHTLISHVLMRRTWTHI